MSALYRLETFQSETVNLREKICTLLGPTRRTGMRALNAISAFVLTGLAVGDCYRT